VLLARLVQLVLPVQVVLLVNQDYQDLQVDQDSLEQLE